VCNSENQVPDLPNPLSLSGKYEGFVSGCVLDKFALIQMLDVHFPTTDGRLLILSRHTQREADQKIRRSRLSAASESALAAMLSHAYASTLSFTTPWPLA